ncbi:MAG: hypothetical protein ACPIOQ_66500, partial [Promethearchaeia archaeon]
MRRWRQGGARAFQSTNPSFDTEGTGRARGRRVQPRAASGGASVVLQGTTPVGRAHGVQDPAFPAIV